MKNQKAARHKSLTLKKSPTGITGFDEITGGGIPEGRPTLICGSAGCGKTLFATEYLVRGVREFNESGVFIAFEETAEDLAKNVASLGFNLNEKVRNKKLFIDYIHIDKSEIEETGDYDLEALFIRIAYAIDAVGAKRIVLDTLEAVFASFSNAAVLRAELRRLFAWLKERKITAIITAERGENSLTRQGLEEYVSDCVILLDHRIIDQLSTRRLRVVKYRGSIHGTNEYPFLIDESGISVLPLSSLGLDHDVSTERVSSGIEKLDAMLGNKGFYRGSSILVSGMAGTGKSSICAAFADATCRRGERCLYFSYEESGNQMSRNMKSIGINLPQWIKKGLLQVHATRPSFHGVEMHLVTMHKLVEQYKPSVVIVDPLSSLLAAGTAIDSISMFTRLIDFLKTRGITALFSTLNSSGAVQESEVGISSLVDAWLALRMFEFDGERNRGMHILKARGMPHSNKVREFVINSNGLELIDVFVGPSGVLTGSARIARQAENKAIKSTGRSQ